MQICGLNGAAIKREDVGVGQEKAFSVEIIDPVGRLLIKGDQFCFVTGGMRRNDAGIKMVHSVVFLRPLPPPGSS